MLIYLFDELGIYTETQEAFEDPRNPGSFLIPENAVDFPPPSLAADEVAVISGDHTAWVPTVDHRGTYYTKADQTVYEITDLGVVLNTTLYTSVAPPDTNSEFYYWNEPQQDWVRNDTEYTNFLIDFRSSDIVAYGDSQATTLAFSTVTQVEREYYTYLLKEAQDLAADPASWDTIAPVLKKIAYERAGTAPTQTQVLAEGTRITNIQATVEDTLAHVIVRVETLITELSTLTIAELEAYDIQLKW